MKRLLALLFLLISVSQLHSQTTPTLERLLHRLARIPFAADRIGDSVLRIYYLNREAKSVTLDGTFSLKFDLLSAEEGIWTADFHSDSLHQAFYTFLISPEPGIGQERYYYRGPEYPAPPERTTRLAGKLRHATIKSFHLNAYRNVSVYLPREQAKHVIYMGDGQLVQELAYYIDPLIQNRTLPPLAIAGAYAESDIPENAETPARRSLEYLLDLKKGNPAKNKDLLEKHLLFFVEEFIPWAERTHNLPTSKANRSLAGFSESAAFALVVIEKHPELFSHLLLFSPLWEPALQLDLPDTLPPLNLAYGELEWEDESVIKQFISDYSVKSSVHLTVRHTGHDKTFWFEEFINILSQTLGATR